MAEQTVAFAGFVFSPRQRRLTRDGEVVRLGSRALDILATLVANAGEVVSKDAIVAAVWPNVFVDEANLRVHMSALRKALGEADGGDRLIENIPGRGYTFVGTAIAAPDAPRPVQTTRPGRSLPLSLGEPIGRDDFIAGVIDQLRPSRLVTVTGPGGMGKTTVAVAAAHRMADGFADGAVFVDLASVNDGALVVAELRAAVEQLSRTPSPGGDIALFLQAQNMLLVLDNCEHLVEPVARLVVQLLRTCPDIRILATSREPLRVPGEWVARLPPLDMPPEGATSDEEISAYPAARLFLDRVAESLGGFALTPGDAVLVADICRRLDGIALAIELAAGRLQALGLRGLSEALDDRFRLLRQGRRTALPRHQTLRATLDWSFGLLTETEAKVLARLSTFSGGFTVDAAVAVASDADMPADDVEDILSGLVAKSLVSVDLRRGNVRHRLLETTRSYCGEKLEGLEREQAERLHARYFVDHFERAEQDWESGRRQGWGERHAPELANLRTALDWAFEHDAEIAVRLTVAAIPLWFQLALVGERLTAAQRAMSILGQRPGGDRRQRMKLNVVLGWPQMQAMAGVESGPAAWRTVLEISRELGDTDYELRALWALWVDRTNSADHPAALSLAQQFLDACGRGAIDPSDSLIGQRMSGRSLHLLGQQGAARESIEHMLQAYGSAAKQAHAVRFQYDQRACAQATLARILLVQGYQDEALALIGSIVTDAGIENDFPTLCHVLSDSACLVAILTENWELASEYVALLQTRTEIAAMDVWSTYGKACSAVLMIERGELPEGLSQLQAALTTLEDSRFVLHFAPFRALQARGLARAGRIAEALATIEAEIERGAAAEEAWYRPELLRTKASILASASPEQAEREQQLLLQALGLAEEQGAAEWELRAAISLVQRGEPTDALRERLERLFVRSRTDRNSQSIGRLEAHLRGNPTTRASNFTTLY